jgi:hypothetical protein
MHDWTTANILQLLSSPLSSIAAHCSKSGLTPSILLGPLVRCLLQCAAMLRGVCCDCELASCRWKLSKSQLIS